jgi:hypothetical protein
MAIQDFLKQQPPHSQSRKFQKKHLLSRDFPELEPIEP